MLFCWVYGCSTDGGSIFGSGDGTMESKAQMVAQFLDSEIAPWNRNKEME